MQGLPTGEQGRVFLGAHLRRLRGLHRWSQERLAAEADLSVSEIQQIERGLKYARIDTYLKLLRVFGYQRAPPMLGETPVLPRHPGNSNLPRRRAHRGPEEPV